MKEGIEFVEEEAVIRKELDYRQALLMQINRIGNLSASKLFMPQTSEIDPEVLVSMNREMTSETLVLAVDFLEAMLSPYLDEEYKKEIKELVEKVEKLKPDYSTERYYAKSKFALLMKLMARLSLLLEKEKPLEV